MLENARALGSAAISAAVGLLLGACTAGPQAGPTALSTTGAGPTTTASAPATPSSPAEGDPAPSPAVERSRETARQFVIDYFQAYEKGLRIGSPEPLVGMAVPECRKCSGLVDGLAALRDAGESWPDADIRVLPFRSEERSQGERLLWTLTYDSNLGEKVRGDVAVTAPDSGLHENVHVEVAYDGTQWLLHGIATESETDAS